MRRKRGEEPAEPVPAEESVADAAAEVEVEEPAELVITGPVTIVYAGTEPRGVQCAGRKWKPGEPQTVDPDCARSVLTHPLFRIVESAPVAPEEGEGE